MHALQPGDEAFVIRRSARLTKQWEARAPFDPALIELGLLRCESHETSLSPTAPSLPSRGEQRYRRRQARGRRWACHLIGGIETMSDHDELMRDFLEDQPQWLGHVYYMRLPESDEPEPALSIEAMQAFITWAAAHPQVTVSRPALIPETLRQLDTLPALWDLHDRGVCDPATCPLCRH
jgi:hypothetical protein